MMILTIIFKAERVPNAACYMLQTTGYASSPTRPGAARLDARFRVLNSKLGGIVRHHRGFRYAAMPRKGLIISGIFNWSEKKTISAPSYLLCAL